VSCLGPDVRAGKFRVAFGSDTAEVSDVGLADDAGPAPMLQLAQHALLIEAKYSWLHQVMIPESQPCVVHKLSVAITNPWPHGKSLGQWVLSKIRDSRRQVMSGWVRGDHPLASTLCYVEPCGASFTPTEFALFGCEEWARLLEVEGQVSWRNE